MRGVRVLNIDPLTGLLVEGRRAGRPASAAAGRHDVVVVGSTPRMAVVYDRRRYGVIADPDNMNPPDGGGLPVLHGWVVPN